jgi:hypothetical protein
VPVPTDAWTPQSIDATPERDTPAVGASEPVRAAPEPQRQPEPAEQQPIAFEQPAQQAAPAPAKTDAAPELPPVTLTLPTDSGLEMVETKHHAPVEPEPEADAQRPRRVRPPRVNVAEEPLQMVETRHDGAPPAP